MNSPTLTGRITHPWTRIADGWPEEGIPVLVLTKDGMAVAKWERTGYAIGGISTWRQWEPTAMASVYGYDPVLSAHSNRDPEGVVSHWMALPELPQEG